MTQTITVEGMSCEHCEQTVEEALENVDGVTAATADRETDSATIEGTAEPAALVNAVSEAGYDAAA
ncbi:Heavy metal transport-detoxification protein [Halorhabdus tiamatea SARL4B]|uniref:Heavy metal transport-detoxification protein n=1 Tax=Halorhabdus tiamatea SARL4B TaxID=1033806 RepID=F7PK27_9EURY|nr:heavy metal-associated domain-containing protein [Halorhabdus tiamatea]ERJ07560.1 Heavy metal transport-detoxification protein [Halorhabdus tiamatea SARL4B]CCQ33491.1 mercuric transport protein [Halorhabdus tiamatea SARL4B]